MILAVFGKTESRVPAAGGQTEVAGRLVQATLIGAGAHFVGDLSSEEDVVIQGRLEGKIVVGGNVRVEAGGEVEGDIEARGVLVAGNVQGEIRAAERAELAPTAVVEGGVQAPKIVIAEGARLTGSVAMAAGVSKAPKKSEE